MIKCACCGKPKYNDDDRLWMYIGGRYVHEDCAAKAIERWVCTARGGMKRYTISNLGGGGAMVEHETGPWVRWEDVRCLRPNEEGG